MYFIKQFFNYILCLFLPLIYSVAFAGQSLSDSELLLSLEQTEQLALVDEPGLASQRWQSQALAEQSISDGQLMDPKLQLGLNNLPADSFNFDQENMTQLKVGIIQQFPSGDSLNIKQQKMLKKSQLIDSKMAERRLTIIKDVRLTYLEIYYWEQAKKTIYKNKKLFTQLVDIVQSLFSVGRNNQQDLIRAQLELSRLDDRLAKIVQKINFQRFKLSRWIGTSNSKKVLSSNLPVLPFFSNSEPSISGDDFDSLSTIFYLHPKIQEIDKELEISRKGIELVKESYKPGWGLNVSYGYRDNNPNGQDRSDFISAGVTIDLPLFTANRQDKKLLSKEYEYQSLKSKRVELLQQLVAQLQQEIANEEQLEKRHQLYNKLLLPQAKQQEQASLLAYQSDRGNFADVMRAYIDNLNANLDERRIAVDHLQAKAKILYFVSSAQK
jgi:outer membrane protein TolC